MTNKFRFTLSILAVLVALGVFSQVAVAAGPTPKECVPLERSFFLTKDTFQADQVFDACPVGFHFASYYEIKMGAFVYNNNLGYSPHLGDGPPARWDGYDYDFGSDPFGWTKVNGKPVPTEGNCLNWTSNANTVWNPDFQVEFDLEGSVMWIQSLEWRVSRQKCDRELRVWCVSDANVQ